VKACKPFGGRRPGFRAARSSGLHAGGLRWR